MDMNKEIREGNVGIRFQEPDSFHIVAYYPNSYYGKREEMIVDGWKEDECGLHKDQVHIGGSCFKNPECNYSLGIWQKKSEGYDLRLIGNRPFELDEKSKEIFMRLAGVGQSLLNQYHKHTY